MNRNQRRFGRVQKRKESVAGIKTFKTKNELEIEEVLPPKGRRTSSNKFMTNRCCAVTPNQKDIAQLTDTSVPSDLYQNVLVEQYGFDPVIPDTIKQLRELKQVLCGNKVENSSQYVDAGNVLDHVETSDGSKWQNVDKTDDIEKYIMRTKELPEKLTLPNHKDSPRSIHISDVPRVKVIAEKYSRYKSNNVELRRLDEKVVCLEYDVYDRSTGGDIAKPLQVMRAFFTIKPALTKDCNGKEIPLTNQLPSDVKRNFNISEADLDRLNEKEVEIIDDKIKENIPYLDDLKRILHRNQFVTVKKTNDTALDLISLYEMARKEYSPFDREFSGRNFLTKPELDEVKDLILTKCTSSVHGITRRKIKKGKLEDGMGNLTFGVISESIVTELMRENGTKQCL